MKVYIKFIITTYLRSFINILFIIFSLVLILNLLTELEFFNNQKINMFYMLYISFLNSPSLVFEMLPFIFLVSTQTFFINLLKDQQIHTFKYSGLKNSSILKILFLTSFFVGILSITFFYSLSASLKNVYLEIKNSYTTDQKYLAVITNNGLWIKDNITDKMNIINASKIDDFNLLDTTITEFDKDFNIIRHIHSKKIDISKKNWLLSEPTVYMGNDKIQTQTLNFYSNFDYERIQGLFSNMSSLSLLELIKLKDTYKILNLSITEVMMQIYKIVSFPIYLSLMTIVSAIIMFNTKNFKSNTLKISIGLFFSVIIYYINNFFNVLGKTEKMPIILSISITMIILTLICSIYCLKINEK